MTGGPVFVSSGDLIADRRYQWALDHAARGDLAGAADILSQTVELAPGFATAWFALGTIRDNAGDQKGAIAAWQKARDADPEDCHGARLQLARLGAGQITPAMTAVYVRRMFDQHAQSYDESLVERLHYRGPQLLLEAVLTACRARSRVAHFRRGLDLGCGTGLAGCAFAQRIDSLEGVDLSPKMLEAARATAVYSRLHLGDMLAFLAGQMDGCVDLVIVADAFPYVADLRPHCCEIARVLDPHGLFAFTAETHAGGDVVLQQSLRFAHGAEHVRAAIDGAGLGLLHLSQASTRNERGAPVAGLLGLASRGNPIRREPDRAT